MHRGMRGGYILSQSLGCDQRLLFIHYAVFCGEILHKPWGLRLPDFE